MKKLEQRKEFDGDFEGKEACDGEKRGVTEPMRAQRRRKSCNQLISQSLASQRGVYVYHGSVVWFIILREMENNAKLQIDEDSTRRFLTQQQWPESLQDVLVKGCSTFVLRYFIIDDSGSTLRHRIHQRLTVGSMAKNDGKRRISTGDTNKWVILSAMMLTPLLLLLC